MEWDSQTSMEGEGEPVFSHGFALYTYQPTGSEGPKPNISRQDSRTSQEGIEGEDGEEDESDVMAAGRFSFSKSTSTGHIAGDTASTGPALESASNELDSGLSLMLVDHSIADEWASAIQQYFVVRPGRLSFSSVGRGSITEIQMGNGTGQDTIVCYYCLVRAGGVAAGEDGAVYLVCLVVGVSQDVVASFDLFIGDLDEYCQGIAPMLPLTPDTALAVDARKALADWHEAAVAYVHRCVRDYGEVLARVLFALCTQHVGAVQCPGGVQAQGDFHRFQRCVCLLQPEQLTPAGPTRVLTLEPPAITNAGSNDFCQRWADELRAVVSSHGAGPTTPFVLRRIIENRRIKLQQDINQLRRMVTRAASDHYALFQCYLYVQGCGMANLLISTLQHELLAQAAPAHEVEAVQAVARVVTGKSPTVLHMV